MVRSSADLKRYPKVPFSQHGVVLDAGLSPASISFGGNFPRTVKIVSVFGSDARKRSPTPEKASILNSAGNATRKSIKASVIGGLLSGRTVAMNPWECECKKL